MATFQSFAEAGTTVTLDPDLGEIRVTGGGVHIDGVLDAIPEIYRVIRCSSGGIIRFRAGCSGTLGGRDQALLVIEEDDAAALGDDNGKYDKTGGGTNARFGPGSTTACVVDNVVWFMQGRSNRSDFDIAEGTAQGGANGCGMTFRGLHLIQQRTSGDSEQNNHMYSQNLKLEIHPDLGFGWKISNYTTTHAVIIENPPNDQFAGLQVETLAGLPNTGGRVVVAPGGRTFTLFNLNTPDITERDNNTNSKTILINPVGVPTRTDNWGGYNSIMEIQRDVPFNFTGADNATGTLQALHQNSNSEAADASAAISSAGQATVRLKTNYSAYGATNGAWASLDGFQFYAVGRGFEKYYSGSTSINVGNAPTTRNVSLTNDAFPNGDAITAYSGTDGADTASEIYRIIKDHELANPTRRTLDASLATIDSSGNIDIDSTVALNVSTTQTPLVAWDSNTSTLTVKVQTGITADKGINSLNFGNRNIPATQIANFAMPTTTSAGTSALVNITAPASYRVGLFGTDGTNHGNHVYSSAGEHSFLLTAASTGTTKVGMGRAGYDDANIDIDTSAGGVFTHTFQATSQQVDALGNALYDSTLSTTGMSVDFDSTGSPTINIPNSRVSVSQCYKVFHDTYGTSNGTLFAAFSRQQPGILSLGGVLPDALFLGANTQLRRAASSGNSAAVNAIVYGGPGSPAVPVNTDRGDVSLVQTISTGGGGSTDLTEVNTKLDAITANTETLQEQNEHLATSLPLTFHAPLSPLCIVTGLEGQEIIRDTEETDWPLTASGIAGNGDSEAHGVVEFDGNNSHLDYSLNRAAAGETPDLYTTEIIVLCQVYPTSFPSSGQRPFGNIGALTLSVNNSTGTTASLHLGAGAGATTTTNQVNLNQWNDLVFVFTRNPDRPNNPRIRVSINGSAQETGNLGADSTLGNNIFGPINSNTQNFRIGGHGTGSQTSGFQGRARAIFVHPSNEVFGTDGWNIPTGVYWNTANQLWQGAQLMDRVEGIAVDRIERTIDSIDEKTFTLEEQANAVLRQPFSAGINPSNSSTASLTGTVKWLLSNVNTTTPATPAAIADAVLDELLSGHTTTGSLGAAISAIPTTTYTVPSASDNAAAVWNATLSSYQTSGSTGRKLNDTSTHDASDVITATASDIWNFTIPNSPTAGTAVAKLNALANGPTAATIRDAVFNKEIYTGFDYEDFVRAKTGIDFGAYANNEGNLTITPPHTSLPTITTELTEDGRTVLTITEPSP